MDIRTLEKTTKLGYMFYIRYNGKKFQSFDEMSGKRSVKGEFQQIMKKIGFSWAKGIQQAGRTDAKVSANENILFVSSNFNGELLKLQKKFNEISEDLKITMIKKTFPNLVFPELIEKREYIYKYPKKKILNSVDKIKSLCEELSGKYDVSRFTDKKGKELQNHIREVYITFENDSLKFLGNSFMPKQVRIMSSFILTNKMEPLEGQYLTLEKIYLKDELKNIIFQQVEEIEVENCSKVEVTANKEVYIFYVPKNKKGEFIGKNGKNIKALKKLYGNIVVREL